MRRRDFLRASAGAVALGALPACERSGGDAVGEAAASSGFSAWTWVHGGRDYGAAEWRRRFAALREAGITAVLVSGGDIDLVADAAHAEGLEFHRWFWTMNRNGDAWVRENHPEWFTVSRNLESSLEHPPYVGYYKWVCPSREPVRAYLRERVEELAAHPKVDGVHLDYVRHCDVILPRGLWDTYDLVQDTELPEFDFCYCEVCRQQFADQYGRDPLDRADPASDVEWRRFRWNSVTRAVRELAEAVHAHGKPITAAVFPTPDIARTLVRQSWDEWPLDRFFPMLYHGFYLEDVPWIGDRVREGIAALAGTDRDLNAGLYLPTLDAAGLEQAVSTAREAGASGVSFFEMEGLTEAHLSALRGVLS